MTPPTAAATIAAVLAEALVAYRDALAPDAPYTPPMAALQLLLDNLNDVVRTGAEYACLFRWKRYRVSRFLARSPGALPAAELPLPLPAAELPLPLTPATVRAYGIAAGVGELESSDGDRRDVLDWFDRWITEQFARGWTDGRGRPIANWRAWFATCYTAAQQQWAAEGAAFDVRRQRFENLDSTAERAVAISAAAPTRGDA